MLKLARNITFILLLLFPVLTYATHLVGGSMSYENMGVQGDGRVKYKVRLKLYRDCFASTVQFDDVIQVGIYNNNSTRSIYAIEDFVKTSERAVDPPGKTKCPETLKNICIREAIYEKIIYVDQTTVGYHLYFVRCCRNSQKNIIDDMGQTYYAYIPPTAIVNSSPYFNDIPAPYICRNDTTTYFNSAIDPDGDSLVYKLVHPWHGADKDDPMPAPPSNLALPFNTVIYRSGFDTPNPFGNTGLIGIDLTNGLTTYMSQQNGRFAVAIDVEEYRNGIKLSTVRLDVQMIVIDCAPNKTPTLNSNKKDYSVMAGEQICFSVTGSDIDQPTQNVTIVGKGNIFTGENWTGPKATFPTRTGAGTVTSDFCWTPSCEQVRPNSPYSFVIEVTDDGCPPKYYAETFSVTVRPFMGTRDFDLPTDVCTNSTGTYTLHVKNASNKVIWEVSGGDIIGSSTDTVVTIKWGAPGTGTVKVTETNAGNCVAPPVIKTLQIRPLPAPTVISGPDTVCEFASLVKYSVPLKIGYSYRWIIMSGGTAVSANNKESYTVNWGGVGNGRLALIEFSEYNCPGDTNFYDVAIIKPAPHINGNRSVCPHARGVQYWVEAQGGSSYQWFVEGGSIAYGQATSEIGVNWGPKGNGKVKVIEINKFGCISDTTIIDILIGYALQGEIPRGDDSVCEFSKGIRYEVTKTNGSIFTWTVTGGTIVFDNQMDYILVDWGAQGNGSVTVIETAWDSINNKPCTGMPMTLNIYIAPTPNANVINGPREVCQHTAPVNFSLNGFAKSVYHWWINGDSTGITGQGTKQITIDPVTAGDFKIRVIETSDFGCVGTPVDTVLTVNPKPTTEGIFGDTLRCVPNTVSVRYHVKGFDSSDYLWESNGTFVSPNGVNFIDITWTKDGFNDLAIVEISDKGCVGDTLRKQVFVDNPVIDLKNISVGFPDDRMEVKWRVANAPFFNADFSIQRFIQGTPEGWVTVGNVPTNVNEFTETKLNTDEHPWNYRVVSKNLCEDNVYSDEHTNVWLTAGNDDDFNTFLNWSRYLGWNNGVRTYEVYRKVNYETDLQRTNATGSDTFDLYSDGITTFVQTYRIKSLENGDTNTSWSNEVTVSFDPIIWVPNAFTPNDDAINRVFKVATASLKTYQITIYNRWGEEIFVSNDPAVSWDGTFKGAVSPEGVYFYMIRYSGFSNKVKNLTGNITLLR